MKFNRFKKKKKTPYYIVSFLGVNVWLNHLSFVIYESIIRVQKVTAVIQIISAYIMRVRYIKNTLKIH